MEDKIIDSLQFLHATSGFVALVVAPFAMIARKSSSNHRRWGKVFFWAMVVVVVTAITLSVLRLNWLMAMVAIFSFHMIASGYRSLYHKKLHEGQKPRAMDIVLQGSAGVINAGLLLWGAINLIFGHRDGMSIVFLAFGFVGLLLVFGNLHRFYKRSHDKQEWLYGHMTGFLGGYIATVSAFSAVNMSFIQPIWLQWLWPTLVGSPLIAYWIRHYKARFTRGRRAKEIFDLRLK